MSDELYLMMYLMYAFLSGLWVFRIWQQERDSRWWVRWLTVLLAALLLTSFAAYSVSPYR